jgi:carboxypeptidase Taq
MTPQSAYDELIRRSREQTLLTSCSSLLGWDEQTYMPRGGAEHRGNQMALLAGLHHEKATDPRVGTLLETIEGSDLVRDPESVSAVNVREIRRSFDRQTKLPRTLVEELARTTTLAQQEWVVARQKSDFPHFRPWLEKIVHLKRREAECLTGGTIAYDALLDEYEPGARSAEVGRLFAVLRRELVPLVEAILSSPIQPDLTLLRSAAGYPIERQQVFCEEVAAALGFDFHRGRLDTTAHPFCTGIGPGDCRITTRYDPDDFSDGLFSVLHETGHGLYDQGLDPIHYGTPMGEAVSLGIHESQSRLWENAVGRSRPFWTHVLPLAQRIFHEALAGVALDDFLFAVNRVEPSLIRVHADEVTYNLHILLRFELEQALLCGDLAVGDVPSAWNESMQRLLGLTPPDDASGCLQDIHWSCALFGYFPTYTLGNLYAAQLFARADAELGDLGPSFARGEFEPILEWMRAKVHRQGRRYRAARLIEHATGAPPSPEPLVEALRAKYGALYQL